MHMQEDILAAMEEQAANQVQSGLLKKKWRLSKGCSHLDSHKAVRHKHTLLATKTKSSPQISYLNPSQRRKILLCKKALPNLKASVLLHNSNPPSNSPLSNNQRSSSLLSNSRLNNSNSQSSSRMHQTTRTTMRTITTVTDKTQKGVRALAGTKNLLRSNEPHSDRSQTDKEQRMNVC
jgi:hypothetical protein